MTHNRILVGAKEFQDSVIVDGNCYLGNSIVGDELSIDTLAITVQSAQSLVSLSYGTEVKYWHDNSLIGKFYLHHVSRVGRELYEINCVSGVGLLDTPLHYGGLYTGQSFRDVLSDIVGGLFPYTVITGVGAIRVYGWLPVATRRENLRQLLFANGVSIKRKASGDAVFDLLELAVPQTINDDRLALDGEISYRAAVSGVVVLEHGYLKTASDEVATLYDDAVTGEQLVSPRGVARTGALVTFDAPVYNLAVTGGSILESGVNYAVLGPSGKVTLTGKKYTHTTREVTAKPDSARGTQNVARVEDATLINLTNSESVAKRAASYYSGSHTVSVDMVVGAERPGESVSFNDPFDDRVTALLMSQDINISNLLVAHSEMLASYVPEHGDVYSNVVVLAGSGTWRPPTGTKKIHAVVIGGGAGGAGGQNGKTGGHVEIIRSASQTTAGTTYTAGPGKGGEEGDGGTGGGGGKIYRTTIQLSGGESFAYKCATGGQGGAVAEAGTTGGNTTFGSLSSSQGTSSAAGFTDILSGKVYAAAGEQGVKGGKGGDGGSRRSAGYDGESVGSYAGGAGGSGSSPFGGGGGGGAALGGPGGAANLSGGAGGKASATAETITITYGSGGKGGPGGGGGGGAGYVAVTANDYAATTGGLWIQRPGGTGGTGAPGRAGGNGCVLVYY